MYNTNHYYSSLIKEKQMNFTETKAEVKLIEGNGFWMTYTFANNQDRDPFVDLFPPMCRVIKKVQVAPGHYYTGYNDNLIPLAETSCNLRSKRGQTKYKRIMNVLNGN